MKKRILLIVGLFLFLQSNSYVLGQPGRGSLFRREKKCTILNCHGLDIECGMSVPKMCTAEYKLGDMCRVYAKCEVIDGQCQFVENNLFLQCKSCIEECEESENPMEAFQCEEECRQKLEKLKEKE